MRQMNGFAFDIRASVEEHEFVVGSRYNCSDAAAIDSRQSVQFEGSGSKDAASIAWRNDGVSLAFVDELDGASNRRIFFLADSGGRLVVHGDNFTGVNDADAVITKAARRQGGVNFRFVADEVEGSDFLVGL